MFIDKMSTKQQQQHCQNHHLHHHRKDVIQKFFERNHEKNQNACPHMNSNCIIIGHKRNLLRKCFRL